MVDYNSIFNKIQDKLNRGEITLEQANECNNLAYTKYVIEKPSDIINNGITDGFIDKKDLQKVDILNKQLKSGKITKEEFDKRYTEIKSKENSQFLPKEGSKKFFDPNKQTK